MKKNKIKYTSLLMEEQDDFNSCVETFLNEYDVITYTTSVVFKGEVPHFFMSAEYREKGYDKNK